MHNIYICHPIMYNYYVVDQMYTFLLRIWKIHCGYSNELSELAPVQLELSELSKSRSRLAVQLDVFHPIIIIMMIVRTFTQAISAEGVVSMSLGILHVAGISEEGRCRTYCLHACCKDVQNCLWQTSVPSQRLGILMSQRLVEMATGVQCFCLEKGSYICRGMSIIL